MAPNLEMQKSVREWLSDPVGERIALTLTFQPSLNGRRNSLAVGRETLGKYVTRLNRRVLKAAYARHRKKISLIAIQEGGDEFSEKQPHLHLELKVPKGHRPEDFAKRCIEVWNEFEWASKTQNHWKICQAGDGWRQYMTKARDKPNFADAMLFEHWHCE